MPNSNQKQCWGNCGAKSTHLCFFISHRTKCAHCIWPKWHLETFRGGGVGGSVTSSPPPYVYTVYCPYYDLWRPSVGGGGVCDIQPTCHMCTLYLAEKWPLAPFSGGGGVSVTQFLSEPQNGYPALTARCSDHKWTSHKKARSSTGANGCFTSNETFGFTPPLPTGHQPSKDQSQPSGKCHPQGCATPHWCIPLVHGGGGAAKYLGIRGQISSQLFSTSLTMRVHLYTADFVVFFFHLDHSCTVDV